MSVVLQPVVINFTPRHIPVCFSIQMMHFYETKYPRNLSFVQLIESINSDPEQQILITNRYVIELLQLFPVAFMGLYYVPLVLKPYVSKVFLKKTREIVLKIDFESAFENEPEKEAEIHFLKFIYETDYIHQGTTYAKDTSRFVVTNNSKMNVNNSSQQKPQQQPAHAAPAPRLPSAFHKMTCNHCKSFYLALMEQRVVTDTTLEDFIRLSSRHHEHNHNEDTPPGYWDLEVHTPPEWGVEAEQFKKRKREN